MAAFHLYRAGLSLIGQAFIACALECLRPHDFNAHVRLGLLHGAAAVLVDLLRGAELLLGLGMVA